MSASAADAWACPGAVAARPGAFDDVAVLRECRRRLRRDGVGAEGGGGTGRTLRVLRALSPAAASLGGGGARVAGSDADARAAGGTVAVLAGGGSGGGAVRGASGDGGAGDGGMHNRIGGGGGGDGGDGGGDPHGRHSSAPEFVRGAVAAIVNVLATFPANKLMFRQQVHGHSAVTAYRGMRLEGVRFLYRGLFPPLVQKTTAMSCMFGLYDWYKVALDRHNIITHPVLGAHVAALLAGSTEAALSPLERIQTILQSPTFNQQFTNTASVARHLWRHGVLEYYRGVTAILARNGPANAVFFSARDGVRDALPLGADGRHKLLRSFVSGALLGAVISTTFYPLNVAKSHMQNVIGGPHTSILRVLQDVVQERGMGALWKGVHVNFTRALASWGVINVTYEFVKERTASWD